MQPLAKGLSGRTLLIRYETASQAASSKRRLRKVEESNLWVLPHAGVQGRLTAMVRTIQLGDVRVLISPRTVSQTAGFTCSLTSP
jgi:hypothetical protein